MNVHLFSPEIMSMLLIFFARIIDVSVGTIRIILISRGYRYIAPILGFVEVLIWLTAISTVLGNLNNIFSYIIYAGGFATGNYVGMLLEAKIAIGYQSVRIITSKRVSALPLVLQDDGIDVTTVEGQRRAEEVILLYTVVPRGDVERVIEIVNMFEPSAFITVEDVKSHLTGFLGKRDFFNLFGRLITKKK